jgi:LysM repeat protein
MASLAGALLATASRASDPAGAPAPVVIVQPHDTLWSIAGRTSPSRNPRAVVGEIRRLNGISDYTIHPGQRLALPR